MNISNFLRFQKQQNILLIVCLVYSGWGAIISYTPKIEEVVSEDPSLLGFKLLLLWMVWLRLYMLVLLIIVLAVVLLYIIVFFITGRSDEIFE